MVAPLAAQAERTATRSAWWASMRRSNRLLVGLAIVVAVAGLTLLAPVIGRYDPNYADFDATLRSSLPLMATTHILPILRARRRTPTRQ